MASEDPASPSPDGSLPDAPAATAPKQTFKSFKKKYAKMKMKYDEEMRESTALFKEGLKITELSKRMKKQHDQLLELLLEFNDSLHIPPHIRYDLDVPHSSDPPPPTEPTKAPAASHDPISARSALNNAKARLAAEEISPDAYRTVEDEVRQSKVFAPALQYSSLLEVPHSKPGDNPIVTGEMETSLGFLSPDEETKYLEALDSRIGDSDITPPRTEQPNEVSPIDMEKEAALHNPVSVYNWLRKHQPQVFLQDTEPNPEKPPSRPSNSRASKRAATQIRREEDYYDEDGVALELDNGTSTSRGKRKRDEDGGYRPKGGSSRPSKKRKEKDDAAYSGKRAK